MKTFLAGITIFFATGSALGYEVYVSGNRVHNAIRNVFSAQNATAGFPGDCFSCHSNIPQIAAGSFGDHFRTASRLVAAGTLSEVQLRIVVQNMNLQNLDSDGDAENNLTEFRNGTDPGDRNSNSANPPSTTTTTRLTAPVLPPPTVPGDINKLSGSPEANYLSSGGCSLKSAAIVGRENTMEAAVSFLALLLIPFGFIALLRGRRES